MPEEPEKFRKIMLLRNRLESKIKELESELEESQIMLDAVESILLEKGFKRAEITKTTSPPKPSETKKTTAPQLPEEVIPLETVDGEHLADIHLQKDSMRIVPAKDKEFNIETPPFNQFLVDRVLNKMQEKDEEEAEAGTLESGLILSYNIIQESNVLRELSIENLDDNRIMELKSAMRWTLEKMHEKTKN
ncbi:MAG: hypothetical protein PVF96_02960 [Candidatus Bathyarchaeota archaeon]|jgi:hypothetical protein